MKKTAFPVRRMTLSAVLLSVALVLKTVFTVQIPLFGQSGMRVGISGIFSALPAFLFGPVYGAVVAGLTDLLGYLLKPAGPYLPQLTLTAAAGGLIQGGLWRVLRGKNSRRMRLAVAVLSALILTLGVCNTAFLAADGVNTTFYDGVSAEEIQTDHMHLVSRLLVLRTMHTKDPAGNLATFLPFVTVGLIGAAVLGLVLLAADLVISKKFQGDARRVEIMPLLIVLVASGLVVTTLNTVVLREVLFPSWKALPFVVVWTPRAIEEILSNTVMAYFLAVLLGVLNRQRGALRFTGGPEEKISVR